MEIRPPFRLSKDLSEARTPKQRSLVAGKYINVEVGTSVGGLRAHGVQHNRAMGRAIGHYLRGQQSSADAWRKAMRGVAQPIIGSDAGD